MNKTPETRTRDSRAPQPRSESAGSQSTRPRSSRAASTRPASPNTPAPTRTRNRAANENSQISGIGIATGAVLCLLLGGLAGAFVAQGDVAVVQSPPTTTTITSTLTERVAIFTDDAATESGAGESSADSTAAVNTAVSTVTVTATP